MANEDAELEKSQIQIWEYGVRDIESLGWERGRSIMSFGTSGCSHCNCTHGALVVSTWWSRVCEPPAEESSVAKYDRS